MRLIDADALKKIIITDLSLPPHDRNVFLRKVINTPTIEAEPVRHGDWYGCGNMWMCTECNDLAYVMHKYCPNCGAKMDGDSHG